MLLHASLPAIAGPGHGGWLRQTCGRPGPLPHFVLVGGAPRTGSTWQHRAVYELLSASYNGTTSVAFGFYGARTKDEDVLKERRLMHAKVAVVKVHDAEAARAAGILSRADLVFVSTRRRADRVASAFGTSWVWSGVTPTALTGEGNELTARAVVDLCRRTHSSEQVLRQHACSCCVQGYGRLRDARGRLGLLRQLDWVLGTALGEAELRRVMHRMENFTASRQATGQRSSSSLGMQRLARSVPQWRTLLRGGCGKAPTKAAGQGRGMRRARPIARDR